MPGTILGNAGIVTHKKYQASWCLYQKINKLMINVTVGMVQASRTIQQRDKSK